MIFFLGNYEKTINIDVKIKHNQLHTEIGFIFWLQ